MEYELKTTAGGLNLVNIIVENTKFTIDLALIVAHPNTMLGRMFSSGIELAHPNEGGEYEIAGGISCSTFRAILNFYENGVIRCDSGMPMQELRDACQYLLIPFDATTIRCENLSALFHELSNDGGRSQFNAVFEKSILPLLALAAGNGDRECHVAILNDDDEVSWDKEYPPELGEEFTLKLHSTPLCRFLGSIDNHYIAKQVMEERGLTKIRVGIEGYPINILKIKKSSTQIKIYHKYIDRPFLHISWEKEDTMKRIVGYRYLSSKSNII